MDFGLKSLVSHFYFIYSKSDGDTKGAEMNKRKLSADLVLTRAHISIKQRDGKSAEKKCKYLKFFSLQLERLSNS